MSGHHLDQDGHSLLLLPLWTTKVINGKGQQMKLKAQKDIQDRDPFVDEPRTTDMTDVSF